jgi:hypothetical protein
MVILGGALRRPIRNKRRLLFFYKFKRYQLLISLLPTKYRHYFCIEFIKIELRFIQRTQLLKIKPVAPAILIFAIFFCFLLAQALTPGMAPAADITLAWDHGDPDLAGYKLYLGNHSRSYTQIIDLGLTTQYTIRNLVDGTLYYFSLKAYNKNGLESSFSNEVWYPGKKVFLPIISQGS